MNITSCRVIRTDIDVAHRRIVYLDCGHRLFPGYGDPDGEVGVSLPCTKCGAEEVAARHVQISRCPGYAVNGNIYRCHPDHEPGGYDVGLGLMCLNQAPMKLEEANAYAALVIAQVGRVLDYEHLGVTNKMAGEKTALPLREEDFLVTPAPVQIPILCALATGSGWLVWSAKRRGFIISGDEKALRLSREDVFWYERDGFLRRETGSDRKTGPRVLTDYGRQCAEKALASPR